MRTLLRVFVTTTTGEPGLQELIITIKLSVTAKAGEAKWHSGWQQLQS